LYYQNSFSLTLGDSVPVVADEESAVLVVELAPLLTGGLEVGVVCSAT